MKHNLLPLDQDIIDKQVKSLALKYDDDIKDITRFFESQIIIDILYKKKPYSLYVLAGTAFQMGYNARKQEEETKS